MRGLLSELRLYFINHIVNRIPVHGIRIFFYRNIAGFEIADTSTIFLGVRFDAIRGLSIGANSVINSNSRIDTRGGVTIGENVSISEDVTILTTDHDTGSPTGEGRASPVNIENYVWLGTGATVLPGVTIREGAVVAACALATKDVLKFTVVGGVPAKQISLRSENLRYNGYYRRFFH